MYHLDEQLLEDILHNKSKRREGGVKMSRRSLHTSNIFYVKFSADISNSVDL